jgi:hypothetical protein
MELKQHYNYVAFYRDGFKIGRTSSPKRRMKDVRAMAFELGRPVSHKVALHTETHIRRVLRRFALPGTLEYFEASPEEALEVVAFTARTQATLEAAGV